MFSGFHSIALAATLLVSSLAAVALPISVTPALAANTYIDCAVFWTPDDNAYVIMTFDSTRQSAGVASSGAMCSDLIGSGNWQGIDKRGDFTGAGYTRTCYVQFNSTFDTVVYAQPNRASQMRANDICNAGGSSTYWY